MRKLYFVCLLTLVAVVLDITLFHSGSVNAQNASQAVHVERVLFNNGVSGDARITGRVVGFHCVDTSGGPQCFVASGFVAGLDHSR
jgi:hypothetical protein